MRRLIALAAIGLVLAGCSAVGTLSPTATPGGSGSVEHPTGSNELVLRFEQGGGFVPMDFFVTQAPLFSLYGDGTAIYQQVDTRMAAPMGGLNPLPFRRATLDEAQMSALLGFALGQGGLAEARDHYENNTCADCPGSIFTIRAGGFDKKVDVYALGMETNQTPDREIRARLAQLADILRAFETQVAAGKATDAGIYQPPAYRAVLSEAQGVPGDVRTWPWDDITLADFVKRPNDPVFSERRFAVITPAQAKLLNASPEGGVYPIAVTGPDGATYTIGLRPLLPDETA
jgi:hypothetical protein